MTLTCKEISSSEYPDDIRRDAPENEDVEQHIRDHIENAVEIEDLERLLEQDITQMIHQEQQCPDHGDLAWVCERGEDRDHHESDKIIDKRDSHQV